MISIILPTYNNEKTIFDSINSILNQNYCNFELIIINDFSTDKTKQIIKSFNDNRIIYLENKKNIGSTKSILRGIDKAKGDYIARMDGDDIALPERLEIQLNYLTLNPNIDLVASNIILFTGNKVIGNSKLELFNSNNINFYMRTLGLPHMTWMTKAEFFTNFKYNPNILVAQDQDLLLRANNFCQYTLLENPLIFVRLQEKINVKYKLKQIYNLLLARINYLNSMKLFYYYPLIFMSFIRSAFFYIFSSNKLDYEINTNSNSKYQAILDRVVKGK